MYQRKYKINDYYEFPFDLNLYNYTKDGRNNNQKLNQDFNNSSGNTTKNDNNSSGNDNNMADDEYYNYKLTGIIVHSGSTESGHYYSLIKERIPRNFNQSTIFNNKLNDEDLKWYRFDDRLVEEIDPKDIPHECYGGKHYISIKENSIEKTLYEDKFYSAYILIYQRKDTIINNCKKIAKNNIPKTIFNKIWGKNLQYLIYQNLFEKKYSDFFLSLIKNHIELNINHQIILENKNNHNLIKNINNNDENNKKEW
ncbi:prion-like-(q/n-rich)-domain-bearing protein [Anaeramoeba flamelloides]|uniref:Prion-like-(Q/n-rich)-domain-bearing protein n=1 Tax=Anaeramoeba flamelloides TaxID=1746091 RepID=A0AAV7YZ24_9EUKA|nr:prion-like-(q/n-rich)-domain-bearing protein [Anaeramoeba flamelloides]